MKEELTKEDQDKLDIIKSMVYAAERNSRVDKRHFEDICVTANALLSKHVPSCTATFKVLFAGITLTRY